MKTGVPGPEGSLGKWQWAEINQALTELAMDIEGPYAQLSGDSEYAIDDADWQYAFLRSRANSIEGGTTEILKNIVAERVLGLPKLSMNFDLTDEQQMLQGAAKEILAARLKSEQDRAIGDAPKTRSTRQLWREMSGPELAGPDGLRGARRPGARHRRAGRADGAARLCARAGPDLLEHACRARAGGAWRPTSSASATSRRSRRASSAERWRCGTAAPAWTPTTSRSSRRRRTAAGR